MLQRKAATPKQTQTAKLPFSLVPRLSWSLVSVVSFLGGVIGTGLATLTRDNALLVGAGLLLVQMSWVTLWNTLAGTDWRSLRREWRNWQPQKTIPPTTPLPYAQTNSPAMHTGATASHFVDWCQASLMPAHGATLASAFAAAMIAIVLAALLGTQALLLTVAFVCITQLAVAVCQANGIPNGILQGLALCTVPLLLGGALFMPLFTWAAFDLVLVSIGFGIAFGGLISPKPQHWALHVGQVLVLILLIATRRPIGAFLVALLWLPHFIRLNNIAQDSTWWLLASVLVTCVSIA